MKTKAISQFAYLVTFFLEGTYGCEISERIKLLPDDKVIVKYYPNSFHETELNSYLKEKGIKKLIVCGMMTHMYVDTTVRAAMDYGYEIDLVADGCATMDLEISGEIIPAQIVQKTYSKQNGKWFCFVNC